jgi:DNA-binding PadR family transcriptional regulator
MPIQHAVLALLTDGPSYGYELKGSFEDSVGPQWGELNIGHLYQILDRLVRDRLVTKRQLTQTDRPDRVMYRLTPAGHEELDRWLEEPFVRQGGYRDDFFLKLVAGAHLGRAALRRAIRAQRSAYLDELSTLAELQATHEDDPVVSLLIQAATLHTQANLKVVDEAEKQAATLVKKARSINKARFSHEGKQRSAS